MADAHTLLDLQKSNYTLYDRIEPCRRKRGPSSLTIVTHLFAFSLDGPSTPSDQKGKQRREAKDEPFLKALSCAAEKIEI